MKISFKNIIALDGVRPIFAAILIIPLYMSAIHSAHLWSAQAAAVRDALAASFTTATTANTSSVWNKIDTGHFTVYYEDGVDINRVARRLGKRIAFFGQGASYGASAEDKIAYRFDWLFSRAREMLDMRPNMPKIEVKIYNSETKLYDKYHAVTGKTGQAKAFYVQAFGTIYTSEDTISDSVIAHEIAHAVIDHYFSTIPPANASEALASYVDMHLAD